MPTAFQQAVELAKSDKPALNSGHILLAVSDVEHGTGVRALQHLDIDPTLLRDRTRSPLARSRAIVAAFEALTWTSTTN